MKLLINKFTWVQTHKELVEYLKIKQDSQEELIELLRNVGVTGLHDEYEEGKRVDLQEMGPFTFFCFLNQYGSKKVLTILQNIAQQLDLTPPQGALGLPSAQALKVMMFSFGYSRRPEDIPNLWELFRQGLSHNVNEDLFEEVLNQYGVGKAKLTEVLFYVDPEYYYPIDRPTIPYLKEVLDIDPEFSTWNEYMSIIDRVKQSSDKPLYELSS
ncbi:MAG: hypothetical protein U5K71_14820 [Gracilimonas sp.]|nr:hypothetical protein [Gracilimonas sp.]